MFEFSAIITGQNLTINHQPEEMPQQRWGTTRFSPRGTKIYGDKGQLTIHGLRVGKESTN